MNKPGKKPKSPSLNTVDQLVDTILGHDTPVEVETSQKYSLMEHLGISQGWKVGLALSISKALSLQLCSSEVV